MPPKTVSQARENLEDSTSFIAQRYRSGLQGAEWQQRAASESAEENYTQAMQEVLSENKRQDGVRDVSDSEWRQAAQEKGAPIIAERVRGALSKWEDNWGDKYQNVLSTLEGLPDPTTDPMTNVDQRLKPVVEAWQEG